MLIIAQPFPLCNTVFISEEKLSLKSIKAGKGIIM
jgi:hypothetical protein